MPVAEYASLDGLGLAALVKAGEVSAQELAEEAIRRIEEHNPKLNAVVTKLYELGRDMARKPGSGPFEGVPFLLKDILGDIAGVETRSGSRFKAGTPARFDHTLVRRYRDAGLIFLGKTNVPEFGMMPTTESALYGACRNPWNTGYSSGGSTGGGAAAVAAGIVPVAHGGDAGGSIRMPASCCGLVGLKPTRGRNPLGPVAGELSAGLLQEHVLTRSVRDSAAMLDCTHGHEPGDPYFAPPVERPYLEVVRRAPPALRIAVSTSLPGGRRAAAPCVTAVEETALLLQELGHRVEEAAPDMQPEMLGNAFVSIGASNIAHQIEAHAAALGKMPAEGDLEGYTWSLYQAGRAVSATQYQMAVAQIQELSRNIGRFMLEYDVLLTPTMGALPMKIGTVNIHERDLGKAYAAVADHLAFVAMANITGQPAISLPLHVSDEGLPVGVMFNGRFGDEAMLFRLAGQLEQARPWAGRYPSQWSET